MTISREIVVNDDGRITCEPDGAPVEIAVDVDAAALREHLMNVWLGSDSGPGA